MPTCTLDIELNIPPELEFAWLEHPEIVKYGAPVLRQVAEPVARMDGETKKLIEQMIAIMRKANGLGLAAPQIGVSKRIFVYDMGEGARVLINPEIIFEEGEQFEPAEGCLSIPGLLGEVKRANRVRVKGFDQRGRPITVRASELEARVIQHEIDHLNGVLFVDKAAPETLRWYSPEEEDEEIEGV